MFRQFWVKWWIGLVVVLAAFAVVTVTLAPLIVVGLVLVAASLVWVGLTVWAYSLCGPSVPKRYSLIWGRSQPPALAVASLILLVSDAVESLTSLESLARSLVVVTAALLILWAAWFIFGGLVVIAFWIARTARDKGRSYVAWFWLGLLFPLIAWIIVASMSAKDDAPTADSADRSPQVETRACPYCAESIRVEAVKCRHCGEFISDSRGPAATSS